MKTDTIPSRQVSPSPHPTTTFGRNAMSLHNDIEMVVRWTQEDTKNIKELAGSISEALIKSKANLGAYGVAVNSYLNHISTVVDRINRHLADIVEHSSENTRFVCEEEKYWEMK